MLICVACVGSHLGCELKGNPQEALKTSFPHPVTGEKVFVMDACHMLKLTRNMLQVIDDCGISNSASYLFVSVHVHRFDWI